MRVSKALFLACALGAVWGSRSTAQEASKATPQTERVTGIGGFFFRAKDPKALAEWYERNLGVTRTPESYGAEPWRQESGPAVFAPFSASTKYFGRPEQQWMINFRVRDLDAMVAQLKRAGTVVDVDSAVYPNGRFARLQDPEGNPIQLWQPKDPRGSRE